MRRCTEYFHTLLRAIEWTNAIYLLVKLLVGPEQVLLLLHPLWILPWKPNTTSARNDTGRKRRGRRASRAPWNAFPSDQQAADTNKQQQSGSGNSLLMQRNKDFIEQVKVLHSQASRVHSNRRNKRQSKVKKSTAYQAEQATEHQATCRKHAATGNTSNKWRK